MLEALIFSTLLYAAVVLATFQRRRVGLANPLLLYLAFHGVGFVLRGWMQYAWRDDYLSRLMGVSLSEDDMAGALYMADVGLLAFWLGYHFLVPHGLVARVRFRPCKYEPRLVLLVGCFFIALGLISLRHDPNLNPNAASMVKTVKGTVQAEGSVGYLTQASGGIGGVLALWAAVFGLKPWIMALFVAYLVGRLLRGWGRWAFVVGALSLAFVDMWRRHERWPRRQWLIAGAVIAVLFGVVGVARSAFMDAIVSGGEIGLNQSLAKAPLQISRDVALLDYVAFLHSIIPDPAGYSYWTQNLRLFTYPIPRAIWPGKPSETNRIDLNQYGNFAWVGGVLSVVGASYMDFGWLGIIIEMALFGAVLATLHQTYLRHRNVTHVAVPYLLALSLLPQFCRDGGINIFVFLYFHVFPSVLALWVGARFRAVPQRLREMWLSGAQPQ